VSCNGCSWRERAYVGFRELSESEEEAPAPKKKAKGKKSKKT
jgi:hypothetical protein